MSLTLRIALGVGLLGIAVGVWFLLRPDGDHPEDAAVSPAAVQSSAPAKPQPIAELATLREENRRLRRQLIEARAQGVQSAVQEPEEATPTAAPTPEEEAAWLEARGAFYDQSLKGQPRNDVWADALEEKARATAAKERDQGVELVDARCYTDFCRMEYSYRDADARMNHIHAVGAAFPELKQTSYAYPGNPEQTRAVMYMSTEGHVMPDFDYESFRARR